MSSRLFVELRDKQGLAYSTGVSYGPRAGDTAFITYIIALPENGEKGREGMAKVLADIRDNGVTDEELERANNKELGTFLLGRDSRQPCAESRQQHHDGAGIDYDKQYPDQIRAVTKEDVQRVAQKYLNNYVISRLDPPQQ